MSVKNKDFLSKKKITLVWTPIKNGPQKVPKWPPEKPRNDPHMLKIPKIFDFYHKTLRLKFVYHGSTIYLTRTFLRKISNKWFWDFVKNTTNLFYYTNFSYSHVYTFCKQHGPTTWFDFEMNFSVKSILRKYGW